VDVIHDHGQMRYVSGELGHAAFIYNAPITLRMLSMNAIRVFLADDQLLIRAGIRALLETLPQYSVVGESAGGEETVAEVLRLRPDIALLDIAMPGMDGIEAARRIRAEAPEIRLLVLSGLDAQEIVERALAAGVEGYLLKDFILAELQLALNTVTGGGRYLSPKIQERLIHRVMAVDALGGALTPRQTEILRLVASGLTTKEVARDLGISPKTVEFHRAQLMEKLGVHDVAGLTRCAMQRGLIS
jgi:DNA-binding NarL/FixJ family response regulator